MKIKQTAKGAAMKGQPARPGTVTDTNKQIRQVGKAITKPIDGTVMNYEAGLTAAKQRLADGLQQLTAVIALQNLSITELSELHDYGTFLTKAVEEAGKLARARTLAYMEENAERTESGGLKLVLPDGRVKEARPQRTGLDAKLVEAALRARSLSVDQYMSKTITYHCNETTAQRLVDDKAFTQDELKNLEHRAAYALQKTKSPKDGEGEQ